MIRFDPAVDRAIIDSAKVMDGRITIHSQSRRTYQVPVQIDNTMKIMVVTISACSRKAFYSTHTNFSLTAFVSAVSFYKRYMNQYQLFVGSMPIPSTLFKGSVPVLCPVERL